MDRFYAEELGSPGSRVVLPPEETRHVKVRRVRPGEEVSLFDGAGRLARARLVGFDERRAVFEVIETDTVAPDVKPLVTVAAAIPKGTRMTDLVRACTEVGAWRIIPMVAERSVVRAQTGRIDGRWRRIAREAAKQSRRLHVPEVMPVAGFGEALALADEHELCLLAEARAPLRPCGASADAALRSLGEGGRAGAPSLREALRVAALRRAQDGDTELVEGVAGDPRSVLVLVGPEGGFTAAEIEDAESRGFVPVRLPLPVMRVETAAPVLVAMIIFACS